MLKTSHLLVAASALCFLGCSEPANSKYPDAATTPQTTANTASQVKQPATTAALNPEHGQPGHRCDIPVGTPLNAPAQPNLAAPQPTFTPPPMESSKAVAASGINPPHGQPGHDCSVAVGAPLNK